MDCYRPLRRRSVGIRVGLQSFEFHSTGGSDTSKVLTPIQSVLTLLWLLCAEFIHFIGFIESIESVGIYYLNPSNSIGTILFICCRPICLGSILLYYSGFYWFIYSSALEFIHGNDKSNNSSYSYDRFFLS